MSAFDVEAAARALAARLPDEGVEVLLVLGSGLGALADSVEDATVVPFEEIPGYPAAGVAGHAGRYVVGRLAGRRVLVQQGRFHLYEGHPLDVVAGPVRVAAALGATTLVATNAAGGIHAELIPGSVVVLSDHINFQFRNPLVGPARDGEPRFPDMTAAYDPVLRQRALATARELGIDARPGVYAAVLGPTFETPAEIRMLDLLGADVVGMSTVPEVVAARSLGLRCLAFSLVTNVAAGRAGRPLSHEEVLEVGRQAGARLQRLILAVLARVDA